MDKPLPDRGHVEEALRRFYPKGSVVELRIPGRGRGAHTTSGYFDDFAQMAEWVVRLDGQGEGIYSTLNPVRPELKARCANRVTQHAKQTTTDGDIQRRIHFLVDIDPVRPAGISATDEEKQAARELAYNLAQYLILHYGWPAPFIADSGNGYHLVFLIDLPNDDDSRNLLERVLKALAALFNTARATIDEKVFNASRIVKIPGSVARKGDHVADRPHRMARALDMPEEWGTVSRTQLEEVAALAPQQPAANGHDPVPGGEDHWLETWLAQHQLAIRDIKPQGKDKKYILEACPFNPEHEDAAIFRHAEGRLGFKCFHKSCEGKGWKELRRHLEGAPNGQAPQTEKTAFPEPVSFSVAEILDSTDVRPPLLVEKMLPQAGASMFVGMQKAGKSSLAVDLAISVASGTALWGYYRVLRQGAVLILEQDDPGGKVSIKDIYQAKQVDRTLQIHFIPKQKHFYLGPALCDWLHRKIVAWGLVFIILDSYTALRPPRTGVVDIVKLEHDEISELDELGKADHCEILLLHHDSHTGLGRDWAARGGGTYGLTLASESQLYIERFRDLPVGAPERLVRLQGHSMKSAEMVVRFDDRTLGYRHVLEGDGAPLYPFISEIQKTYGTREFSVPDLIQATGTARSTAFRHLGQLYRCGVVNRKDAIYSLAAAVAQEVASTPN